MALDETSLSRIIRGALAGILSGGLALGIAQLVAGLIGSGSSPVVAVGELSIDFTPPALKNFAISAFGSHDKLVLVLGILVVLAAFAALIGLLAVAQLRLGMIGLGVFILIGLIAALTRPGSGLSDALPTLVGGVAAAWALRRLATAAALLSPAPAASAPAGAEPARPLPGYVAPPPGAGQAGDEPPGEDTGPETGREADRDAGAPDAAAGQAGGDRPGEAPSEWWQPGGLSTSGRQPAQPPRRAPARPSAARPPAAQQRRSFLTTGAVVAGTALVSGVGGNLLSERGNVAAARRTLRIPPATLPAPPLPAGTDFKIPGLASFITPNSQFYRVDTAIVLPEITPASWKLRIHGMVARELTLSFDDLIRRPLMEDYITLCCVSNPVAGPYIGNAKWLGASLRSLLREAGIRAGATQLLCTSTDGFTSGTPVEVSMDGRDSMLAVAMNGSVLPVEHGFPVRLVVPGLYGYVSACKWITDIEVTTYEKAHAYWSVRGWNAQAPIKTESRIDVPSGSATIKAGRHAVAGVAWAQHKGIDAVEVRVDRGPWQEARLATVPGVDTWRQWVLDWDAAPGAHLIESRATDRTGYTQTSQAEPPEPNGATGYPALAVQVS